MPDDPSFYVNAPAHTDPSMAPEGKDALYVLVPVPHRAPHLDWKVEGPKVRAKVFARLKELGIDLEPDIEVERSSLPTTGSVELNLERGFELRPRAEHVPDWSVPPEGLGRPGAEPLLLRRLGAARHGRSRR